MENNIKVLSKNGKLLPNTNKRKASYFVSNNNAYWVEETTIKLKNPVFDKTYKRKIINAEFRTCYICGRKIPLNEYPTVDHVRSVADGGSNHRDNLRCCCIRCNDDKQRRSLDDYVIYIDKNRKKYKYISDKQLNELKFHSKNIEPRRKGNQNEQ